MSNLATIEDIKKKDKELCNEVLSKYLKLEKKEDREKLKNDAEELSKAMEEVSTKKISIEDYIWLTNTAIKWQVVFSATINIPKTIKISLPTEGLLPSPLPADRSLSEEEIHNRIDLYAYHTATWRIREVGRECNREEMERDDHLAKVCLASEILDGKLIFASRVASNSYYRLEQIWLKEVKLLMAYFNWRRRDGIDPTHEADDYYMGCEHLRIMLTNDVIKAVVPQEFEEAKSYLESRYLTNGKFDQTKPEAKKLIERKAYRISERVRGMTGKTDNDKNWIDAEAYVEMFYENIIPAVIEKDREKVLRVLKAFQFSKAPENRHHIIDCFETALAIYFLKADIIQELWNESAEEEMPPLCTESAVQVHSWPKEFKVPKDWEDKWKHRFWYDGEKIIFKGVMSELQKQTLLERFKEEHSAKQEHFNAIYELFKKSRLIHRETTL